MAVKSILLTKFEYLIEYFKIKYRIIDTFFIGIIGVGRNRQT